MDCISRPFPFVIENFDNRLSGIPYEEVKICFQDSVYVHGRNQSQETIIEAENFCSHSKDCGAGLSGVRSMALSRHTFQIEY